MKRVKYRYLYRLAATVILLLFVPVLLFYSYFWEIFMDKIDKGNRAYYEKQTEVLMSVFHERLAELKQHSSIISAESREPRSVFYGGYRKFAENPYWLYEAVAEFGKEYGKREDSECGIYYYDMDCVITRRGTMTSGQYITYLLKETAQGWEKEAATEEIEKFFARESYQPVTMLYGTTCSESLPSGGMLVGYCTVLGKNKDTVLIFYVLEEDAFEDFLNATYGGSGIEFSILDKKTDRVLLRLHAAGNTEPGGAENSSVPEERRIYRNDESILPFSFVIRVSPDSPQNNIVEFHQDMRRVLLITVFLMLAICLGALYVTYRPVYRLVKRMGSREEDEFTAVQKALDNRSLKIEQQEMLILDLLLNHLIYGIPISEKRLRYLGIADMTCFRVYILYGQMLLSADVEEITEEAGRAFGARIFVTDWEEGTGSILIVFMADAGQDALKEYLFCYCKEHFEAGYTLSAGRVVSRVSDIRASFLSCGRKAEPQKGENRREERQVKMREEILNYLEVHFRDEDLGQAQVADTFHISTYTLSRIFKNQVGVGFVEYVNYKRLEYAKELLLTTDYSVKEIALMSGFANDNYFSKVFKSSVGLSPTVFRDQ